MQKLTDIIYKVSSFLFGKGTDYRNGRKAALTFYVITLMFICAIFVSHSKEFLTNAIFMGGIVSVVGLYFGSNALSKKYVSKNFNDEILKDNKKIDK